MVESCGLRKKERKKKGGRSRKTWLYIDSQGTQGWCY